MTRVPQQSPAQLAAEALAAELAPLIAGRQPDPRLHWTKAGRARVRIRRIFDIKANRESTRWRAMIDFRIGRHLPDQRTTATSPSSTASSTP